MNRKVLAVLGKDPFLKPILNSKLKFDFKVSKNLYAAIVENIIGQQLSSKPAEVIEGRFLKLFPGKSFPKPQAVLKISDEKLRNCGMSWSKVRYIKNLSQALVDRELNLDVIKKLPDEDVIEKLTKIKGIGRWTAEMILIFHLGREDVFSVGDLGLRTAVSKLYRLDRDNLKSIEKISQNWQPYRSHASRFLWEHLDTLKSSPKSL